MAKIGILGAGSCGTALSLLLSENGHEVTVWSIQKEEVEMLSSKREHLSKLPGVKLPDSICFTGDIASAVVGKDICILAVPSIATRSTAAAMREYVKDGQILVNVAKGIEENTLMTLTEQIEEEIPYANVAVLSGPSHAEEVGSVFDGACSVSAPDTHQETLQRNRKQTEIWKRKIRWRMAYGKDRDFRCGKLWNRVVAFVE